MDVASDAFVRAKSIMHSIEKTLVLIGACLVMSGCAAVTNPVADGIPVSRVQPELLARSKADMADIPYVLLRRRPIEVYRVAAGDTLGIVLDDVLGDSKQFVPVRVSDTPETAPSLGYPIPVRDDGTISMPQVPPIKVDGMSLSEVENAIRKAYTVDKKIIRDEKFSVVVTIYRKRTYNILVIRQDSGGNVAVNNQSIFGSTSVTTNPKRGTGQIVQLAAGENDVLSALAKTGGMPGIDAINEVVIERTRPASEDIRDEALPKGGVKQDFASQAKRDAEPQVKQFIRIPLRLRPGEPFNFTEQDIILKDRDVIFIAARDADVFYTAGLLGGGQFSLPRDRDVDVIQAIALVRGPLLNGGFSGNNLQGNSIATGIGNPNPSRATILRKTAGGGEVRIKVDLNVAFRDIKQRPLMQAGDILVLQQSPGEAFAGYVSQVLKIDTVIKAINSPTVSSDVTTIVP